MVFRRVLATIHITIIIDCFRINIRPFVCNGFGANRPNLSNRFFVDVPIGKPLYRFIYFVFEYINWYTSPRTRHFNSVRLCTNRHWYFNGNYNTYRLMVRQSQPNTRECPNQTYKCHCASITHILTPSETNNARHSHPPPPPSEIINSFEI